MAVRCCDSESANPGPTIGTAAERIDETTHGWFSESEQSPIGAIVRGEKNLGTNFISLMGFFFFF